VRTVVEGQGSGSDQIRNYLAWYGTRSRGINQFNYQRHHRLVSIFVFVVIPESLRGGVEIKLLGALGTASVLHREFGHQFPVEMLGGQMGCKEKQREYIYIYIQNPVIKGPDPYFKKLWIRNLKSLIDSRPFFLKKR
jgi:hypothetical protein